MTAVKTRSLIPVHSDYCAHYGTGACKACVRPCALGLGFLKSQLTDTMGRTATLEPVQQKNPA